MSDIVNALKTKYESEIAIAKVNIKTWEQGGHPGIADHINYTETLEKEVEKIAHALDMLEALDQL